MFMRYTLMFTLVIVLRPGDVIADVTEQLDEAEAYLVVNPARTITILDSIAQPEHLPAKDAIRRYVLLLRATVPTNDMERLLDTLDALFSYQQQPEFLPQIVAITSALGIWLRRNDYLHEAKSSFACAQRHATTERQRLTLLNSRALVARQLHETAQARDLFLQLRQLTRQPEHTNLLAMAENNLGLLALDDGDINKAEPYFREALAQYQAISQRAGQISAGINLLFFFILKEDVVNFQRLYAPTARLSDDFPNQAKQALLLWLYSRFEQLQGKVVADETKQQLYNSFTQLEDSNVKILVQRYLAPVLEVNVNAESIVAAKSFTYPWFEQVKACAWPLPAR